MFQTARTCRCTLGALVFERDHCSRCGRDLFVTPEVLGHTDGLLLLEAAVERKRIEMREAGRFDHLYVEDGLNAILGQMLDQMADTVIDLV